MDTTNDEKNVVEQKAVETETTQTSPPQVEAQTTEEQTVPKEQTSDDLPKTEEEQRRAFQEQRLEIKRLKEEKEARTKAESAFAPFRQRPVPGQVASVQVQNFTDPVTGIVDWNRYDQAVNGRIRQAESLAVQASDSVEERIDEMQARQKYPDLFSDQEIEREIADKWLAAKMRGEDVTISSISEKVAKKYQKAVTKAEKIGAEKMLNEVSSKEQGSLSASAQSASANRSLSSQEELEKLRVRSRGKGRESEAAVVERLKGIPWK